MKAVVTASRTLPTRAVSLQSPRRQWWTRLQHRAADLWNIAAFSLYPLSKLNTSVALTDDDGDDHCHRNNNIGSGRSLDIEQWTALGSGGFVWGGSRRLANYLRRQHPLTTSSSSSNKNNSKQGFDSSYWKGLNVIELGAGTGALGLSVAAMGANVTLTDQAAFVFPDTAPQGSQQQSLDLLKSRSLLDLLRVNVDNNRHVWKNTNETSVGSSNNNNSNSNSNKYDSNKYDSNKILATAAQRPTVASPSLIWTFSRNSWWNP